MAIRSAHTAWTGALQEGSGQVELTSSGLGTFDVDRPIRASASYFVTQAPTDVPSPVLSQLGNRIQHALRAFTPDDADALRKTARTFPVTTHYDVERTITSLGIGEALVTVLSPKGVPTPLAATRLVPPDSRMAPLTEPEIAQVVAASPWPPGTARRWTGRAPTRSSPPGWPRPGRRRAAAAERDARPGLADHQRGPGTMTPAQQKRRLSARPESCRKREAGGRAGERKAARPGGGQGGTPAGEDGGDGDPDRRTGRLVARRAVADPRRVRTIFGSGKRR